MRGLQTRSSILHNADKTLRESLRIVRIRYDRGITNELDLTLAIRELGVLEAQIAPVDAQVGAAQYTIATLLGLYPEDLVKELTPATMIPSVPAGSAVRPTSGSLAPASRYFAGRARAGRLQPHGSASRRQISSRNCPSAAPSASNARLWEIQSSASTSGPPARLLPGHYSTSVLWMPRSRSPDCALVRSWVNYKRTIQNAVKEVDTTWDAYAAEQDRVSKLGDALVASQRAVTLANDRYSRGLTDFLNVVDAERQAYDIEEQYSDAQVAVDEQFVALYRSLGGGWEQYQALPPVHFPQPAIIAAFHRVLNRGNDVLKDQGAGSP